MWQSHVEIEDYLVTYFDCIIVFEALYLWTSVTSRTSYVLCWIVNIKWVYKVHMIPAFNDSSAIQLFQRNNTIEVHGKIIFKFYMGLPHMDESLMPPFNNCREAHIMSWLTLTGLCLARIPSRRAVYEATMESSMCRPAWFRAVGVTWHM